MLKSSLKSKSNILCTTVIVTVTVHWEFHCFPKIIIHLLLHCPVASDIWSYVFTLCGIVWVMPDLCLTFWSAGKAGFSSIEQWRCGVLCLFVLCGICSMKETGGFFRESSAQALWSKSTFCSTCLIGCDSRRRSSHIFYWFHWFSFFVIWCLAFLFLFWIGSVYIFSCISFLFRF